MKRRSFLGLLGGAVVAPFAKADEPKAAEDAWAFDAYQTPFMPKSPAFDCYVSDFGPTVIIKRPTIGDRLTIEGNPRTFEIVHKSA